MTQHSPVIEIVMQDVSSAGPDFVTGIYSAAFDIAQIAAAFGDTEPAEILHVSPGAMGWEHRDQIRPRVVQCYGAESDPATAWARGETRLEFAELFTAIDNGEIPPEQLVFAAQVIERYLRLAIASHGDIG